MCNPRFIKHNHLINSQKICQPLNVPGMLSLVRETWKRRIDASVFEKNANIYLYVHVSHRRRKDVTAHDNSNNNNKIIFIAVRHAIHTIIRIIGIFLLLPAVDDTGKTLY